MKNRYVLIVLWLVLAPAAQAQHWYKGNLHTHSLWSDGDDYPEMIMDWYKANGYNFVGLSDHNIIQDVEKWVNVPKQKDRRQTFDRYLRNFGPDWVTYQKGPNDSLKVRLKKLEEYRSHFEEPEKFLIIKSEELSTGYQGKPIHINVTNVQNLIRPQPGNSVAEVMQNNIDLVVAQRRQTRQPMFPHINHPNFYYAITAQDLMKLRNERFFEVFNGHPLVNNYGDSTREGTEAMWDKINHHFIQQGRPLMYGLGTDDSHHYYFFGPTFSNSGRAWVMVNAPELTPKALIEAMEAGRFYSTSGVTLKQLPQQGNTLRIDVKPEPKITYKIQFFGIRKGAQQAELLREVSDTTASFTLTNDLLLIRAKIISSKPKYNPYIQSGRPEDAVETAWTQPIAQSIPPTPVANVVPLPSAHAHNDYEQSRPLWDALDNGFTSIEADVHLIDDTLYVAHERPSIKRPELSLENLYLKPLAERIRQNNGQVLVGYKGPFYLMIDAKTQADSTYRAIEKLITRYQSLLTLKGQRLLTVVLSGNRPLQALTKAKSRLLAVDGRPNDLGKGYKQTIMPIISDAYQNQLAWRGKGDIPASEFQKLRQLVDKTHHEGKKLRLWASPEDPQVWAKLREAGVDFISTDQLELARDFLLKQNR